MNFKWEPYKDQGIFLSLTSSDSNLPINFDQWPHEVKKNAMIGLSKLESLCEENIRGISREQVGYIISHHILSSLSVYQCNSLNLPNNIPYALHLKINGPLTSGETKIRISWHAKSGNKVPGEENGSIFFDGKDYFRIPDPIFSLIQAAEAFNESDSTSLDSRLNCISNLKLALEECSGEQVSSEKVIGELKFHHASALSLDIKPSKNGIDFDPVIFSKELIGISEENGEQVKQEDSLLNPQEQEFFATEFRRQDHVKSTYVLGRGNYVFLDPKIRQQASCIKKYQSRPPEERARFAKSPQSFFRDELLEANIDEESVDRIIATTFVETDVFSQRVLEVGLWKPPVLPFVKRKGNTWVPDGFGLQIGSKEFFIRENELEDVTKLVAKAIKDQKETVLINGGEAEIPVGTDTLNALNALLEHILKIPAVEVESDVDEKDSKKAKPIESTRDPKKLKSILHVQNNFESEAFIAQFFQRYQFNKFENPIGLKSKLKDHQIDGVSWMQECWSLGYPGVLLADDMGLGKTFQTLSFLCWLKEKRKNKSNQPILVVAPISLLGNWEKEVQIHLDESALGSMALLYSDNIKVFKNKKSSKADVVEGESTLDVNALRSHDWILTNYNTMRDYHMSLGKIEFMCIVFDEMQNIKNPAAMMTAAAQALNADFQIGLTGTPIENSLADIWTLFDTLMPGFLGLGDLRRFMNHYNIDNPENLKELKNRLSNGKNGQPAPMLRRMKQDVAKDLPEKIEKIIDEFMPDSQAHLYHQVIQKAKGDTTPNSKLDSINKMRSVSLHPSYIDPIDIKNDQEFISASARLKVLIKLLQEINAKKEKVLIFVESLNLQEWLAFYLKENFGLGRYPDRIYGDISAKRRTEIVTRFQDPANQGFDALILSPKAAGVGITLTAAANVIHLTRWWNPAVEDQCTDRAYRIGQDKEVTVYLPRSIHPLYGNGSFDCLLHDILENKRALSREMLVPLELAGDIDFIFSKTVEK